MKYQAPGAVNGRRTYAQASCANKQKPLFTHMEFNWDLNDLDRLDKAYMGIVENPGMTYNIQNSFHLKGYFNIKATPLGANLCLLEENEYGELEFLVSEEKDWLGQWFSEIRKWSPKDVDNERLTWLRSYGIPCHALCSEFFQFLTSTIGTYLCSDDETQNQSKFKVATKHEI